MFNDMDCYHWIAMSLLILGSNFFAVSSVEVSFTGSDYIEYDLNAQTNLMDSGKTKIQFSFMTINPNGLLLFSKGTTGDFLQLELKEGKIRYTANLGGLNKFERSLGEKLHDAKWHRVQVTRIQRQTVLEVDRAKLAGLARENFQELNLDTTIYVGGMRRGYIITGTQNYKGCMQDVIFQDIDLLQGAKDNTKNFKTHGKPVFKCTSEKYEPITFRSSNSYVKVTLPKLSRDNNSFSTSFMFRTFYKDGLLFSRSAIRVKFHLQLRGGALFYHVLTPNSTKTSLRLGSDLHNGEWHSVNASVNGQSGKLQVSLDGSAQSRTLNRSSLVLAFANKSLLKIFAGRGGQDSKYQSFMGCMLNLKVDSHQVSLREMKRKKHSQDTMAGECELSNRCFPNPCNNRGACSHDGWKSVCTCNAEYEGKRCEESIYKPTCEVYKALGLRRNAECLLDSSESDEPDPYTALCNVTNPERSYTVVSHNVNMKKIKIGTGRMSGSSRFYEHDITYNVPMGQIVALIQKSKKCRQYIRYDCHNAKLLNLGSRLSGTPPNTHAHWMSRNGSLQRYWGGATPGKEMCACGIKNKCVEKHMFCNCDSRQNNWLVDDGYLTDKNSLPVMQVMFRNKSARSFYTLGPLECWGMKKSNLPMAVDEVDQEKMLQVCPNTTLPTTATTARTTEQTSTTHLFSTQEPCILPDGSENRACSSHYSSTPGTASVRTVAQIFVEATAPITDDTVVGVSGKQTDASADDGLSTALTALLSCSLVVALLLAVKFGLPHVIVCIRTHSKRGEYIVPPAGVGYPARLMPLMTGRRASVRGRLTHSHVEKHVEENGAAGGGMKSYWV